MLKQLRQIPNLIGPRKTLLHSEEGSLLLPVIGLAFSWDVARVEFLLLAPVSARTLAGRRHRLASVVEQSAGPSLAVLSWVTE